MKKIPSVFMRKHKSSEADVNRINPECQWVFDRSVPIIVTVKRDGTAMLRKDGQWYQRRVVKIDVGTDMSMLQLPDRFQPAQTMPTYDQENYRYEFPGWVPLAEQFRDYMLEAGVERIDEDGTYELCGPKINGNPERLEKHQLFKHGYEEIGISPLLERSAASFIEIVKLTRAEGIVIYSADDCMAKIRRREFGFDWPIGN